MPGCVARRPFTQIRKIVFGTSVFALVLMGLAAGGTALSMLGSRHADAQISQPLAQLLPSYGIGVLPKQPGSSDYPGLVSDPRTYSVYTDSQSGIVDAENWQDDLSNVFKFIQGSNSSAVSGYAHMVMLPGDSMTGHGAVALGMNSSGTSVPLPDGVSIMDLYSPMGGYFRVAPLSNIISNFEYTPGSGECATKDPTATALGTVHNLWCMGVGFFTFEINDIQPPANGSQWLFGFEPNWAKILSDYPGISSGTESGLRYLSGPNDPELGANATNQGYILVPNPRLQLIKEVCSTGTGCIDDQAGSLADTPVPDNQPNTGLWVDAATLPLGSQSVEWRITVKNTGNLQLMDVHLANDKTATDPKTSDADVLGADDCMTAGAHMGDLMPGASNTIYCTSQITGGLESDAVNWANANGSIPDYVNYLTGAAGVEGGNNVIELSLPEGLPTDQLVAASYQGNAEASGVDTKGMVPSNNDAAMINSLKPALKLTKWVCGADSCDIPTGNDLALMAGYDANTGAVVPGVPEDGWVKAAQVDQGASAQWLMIATNIGNTNLADVTLRSDTVTDADLQIAPASFTKVSGQEPLPPGGSAIFTAITDNITNMNAPGQLTSTPMHVLETDGFDGHALFLVDPHEFVYEPGKDVVDRGIAEAHPVNSDGQPLTDSRGQPIKGADGQNLVILSNESIAEVTTNPQPSTSMPGIKLTKWVCASYTDVGAPNCNIPTGDDLVKMAGFTPEGGPVQGQPDLGWVKYAQVPYDATVQWLLIATNIGDTNLKDVTLKLEEVLVNGQVVDQQHTFTRVTGDDVGGLLPPGGHVVFTSTSDDVISEGHHGGPDDSTSIIITVSGTAINYATGEEVYTPGDDEVNEAVAMGTPADEEGVPMFFSLEEFDMPLAIESNLSLAEVFTEKPPVTNTGGSLITGFGMVPLCILVGMASGVFWVRRRTD